MKILVANIGSTSFKFRLFELDGPNEVCVASGGADRIGSGVGTLKLTLRDQDRPAEPCEFADHESAIRYVLDALRTEGLIDAGEALDAVAFKAVLAGRFEPVALVDDDVLARMERFAQVAPAHNPPYVAAMRMFRRLLPQTPLIAAFEPGFHLTMPDRRRYYAVPRQWAESYGVVRYGFHGASHRYVATRMGELMGEARRIISCHLGGSSSICAIKDGKSQACSLGLSPQSGLPQSNRAGEFDPFALPLLKAAGGLNAEAVLEKLATESGLAALSGTSGDIRDILTAVEAGDQRARLALDVFITAARDYLGAYLVELGGVDAIVFTGGIGQHNPPVRSGICEGLDFAGIRLDEQKNQAAASGDRRIDADGSSAAIWVVATNEELIVARQAAELLRARGGATDGTDSRDS